MLTMEMEKASTSAKSDLLDALEIHHEIGYERGRWEVTTLLGEWHAMHGDHAAANHWFEQAVGEAWPSDDERSGIDLIVRQLEGITEHERAERLREAWAKP